MQVSRSGRRLKTAPQSKARRVLEYAVVAFVLAALISIELLASATRSIKLEGQLPRQMARVIDQRLSSHPLPQLNVKRIPREAIPGGTTVAAATAIPMAKTVTPIAVAAPLDAPKQPAARLKTTVAKPKSAEDKGPLGGSVSYGVSTDLAKPEERRTYSHTLGVGVGYSIKDVVDLGASLSGQMTTVDRELDGNQRNVVELADVGLSAGRGFKLGEAAGGEHSLNTSIAHTLPTSEDSRYEGVKGITGVSAGTSSKFFGGTLTVGNAVSTSYIFNTFSHSPVSNKVNPEHAISDALSFSVRLMPWLRFSAGGSISWMRYNDGSVIQSFGNSLGLSGTYKEYSVGLRSSNGAHPDEASRFQMLYYDYYRRMTSLSISRGF